MTPAEFAGQIHARKRDLPRVFRWLDVTSWTGLLWVAFGLAGQAVFMGRMLIQWWASEKVKSSVVPPMFWWLSLIGSSMLLIYFVWRKEPVGFIGQCTGWFIYVRNLWFIYGATPAKEK
ncbi:MAG: lipid A biosynthesis protein [Verrucomicrobiales bacterium]|nr:lipid A biosynthesis protein [Verrucomicrobiales bacterium]